MFMKKCYGDPTLTVSMEDFERPKDLKIKVDCYAKIVKDTTETEQNTDEFGI
jgi:penicillin-binding protein 1A